MRPYEFWHPRVFEAPYYFYLLASCLRHGLPVKSLAKANYALDHGELGLGSKFTTQMAFDQSYFLPTELLQPQSPDLSQRAEAFATQHGFPLILKPDIGAVGKGVTKITDRKTLISALAHLKTPFLLQAFSPHNFEYGVFYVRRDGQAQITGINQKHFPEVTGNGRDTIQALAIRHPRYTDHWGLFLRYLDVTRVPEDGEVVRLSFVGSHTMGCKFTDDLHLSTRELEAAIFSIGASQPGFNFGRLDVKAESEAAFAAGRFHVIEVNGIASLPTQMFDPRHTLSEAYGIFLRHGRYLVETAMEHRHQSMQLDNYRTLWRRAKENHVLLNQIHADAIALEPTS